MPILEIIKIIMQILAFIAGLFGPKAEMRYAAYVTDYDCRQAEWTGRPSMAGGVFSGTVEMRCTFDGKGGGGIEALREHLGAQLVEDSSVPLDQIRTESFRGLPGIAYDTTLKLGEGATAEGVTHLATNSFTVLRSAFESKGNGQYLKGVYSEMEVRAGKEEGVFELRVIQSMQVKKPALISASSFQSSLMDQAEESLKSRAIGAVQEMASHL